MNFSAFAGVPSIAWADDWPSKLFRLRAPGNWEPIASIYLTDHIALLVPVLNILLAILISVLLAANFSVAVCSFTSPRACGRKSGAGILGSLPSLQGGFGCCVPTAALALGASFVAAFAAIGDFLLRASIAALGLALVWNASRLSKSRLASTYCDNSASG